MFILKNSMKNIVRNKGRNILLVVIMFVIIVSTVVSLAINNTATAIINDYKERFSSEVVISLDIQSLMGDRQNFQPGQNIKMPEMESITSQMYLKYGESEHLDQTKNTYTATVYCVSDSLTPLENPTIGGGNRPGGGFAGGGMGMQTGDFILYGDYWDDFDNDSRWIIAGEWTDGNNECLISSELAAENGLDVGDTISIKYELTDSDDNVTVIEYNLTIAGIYYDNTDSFGRVNRRNEIMTNFATAVAPFDDGRTTSGITVNATYYLKNPSDLDKFEAEIRNLGDLSLPSIYNVTTDSATYDQIVKPVLSLKNISLIFLIVILVLGSVILTVLAIIAIRERKYEIGTLRAIGMKKSKIFAGLLTEIMVITCICLIIGLTVGFFVSQPISDALLNQQIEAAQTETQQPSGGFGGGGNRPSFGQGEMQSQARPGTEALSEMKINFDFLTILEIAGVAILLAAVPTAASAAKITKYEPMRILSERN